MTLSLVTMILIPGLLEPFLERNVLARDLVPYFANDSACLTSLHPNFHPLTQFQLLDRSEDQLSIVAVSKFILSIPSGGYDVLVFGPC